MRQKLICHEGIILWMKRIFPLTLIVVLFLTTMGFLPGSNLDLSLSPARRPEARPGVLPHQASAQELIDEVNRLRAENDLPPYQVNPVLMKIAQTQAEYIASSGVLTHFDLHGLRPYQRALNAGYAVGGDLSTGGSFSENIHAGPNLSPVGAVTFWTGDAIQKDAMLSTEFQDAGAGTSLANGVTYYVLNVGSEGDQPAVPPTAARPSSEVVISTAGAIGTKEVVVFISTPSDNGEVYHLVRKGEALWSIALAYKTTIDQIRLLNGLSGDQIFEGQNLLVIKPLPDTETPSPVVTATFGIPTSTPTRASTPTLLPTLTPLPQAPASVQSGGVAFGIILLAALLGAGIGALLGRKKKKEAE